jgi:gliding motility-associated protein GldM
MIGMMYLVLTAMLALNVSKEAVEAFKKVDKGLTRTIANYSLKNDLIYKEFDRAAAENPGKAGKYKAMAMEVKSRSDEIFNYIQDLKIEIITTAEGPETPAVNGREIIIEKVQKIDENNVPSEILIGANENGKANNLKALINEYRDFLITTLDGKNPTAEDALKTSLNTDDAQNEDGEKERWENLTFQTLPLVAVITILSKFQVDVRNAETEVINHLYNQIDAASFKFNKLNAIVIPNSNYIQLGSEYQARVFLSATDTTQHPEITLDGGSKLAINEAGEGIYTVKATSTGSKTWGGVISLKAPNGTMMDYRFKESYSVGEPNVVVSPTGMNVLYVGLENPIDVSVPGVGPDKIKLRVTNGDLSNGKVKNPAGEFFRGNYIIKPKTAGTNVQVFVTAEASGKPVTFAPLEFRVKRIPPPIAVFGGKSSGTISKQVAVAQQGVFASLPDFDFQLVYNITGFTILTSERGEDFEEKSSGSSLTPKQKELITRLTRGKNLFIKDIQAKGPDGRVVDLPAIILKIE